LAPRGRTNGWKSFYTFNDNWLAEDRRKLSAFAPDLLNSDYADHRLTFVQFAHAPHFNHLNTVCNAFDFSGPLDFVKKAPDLPTGSAERRGDGLHAVTPSKSRRPWWRWIAAFAGKTIRADPDESSERV
jgi:4-hydroxyphenylacetate 3-hydroxylase C terminal